MQERNLVRPSDIQLIIENRVTNGLGINPEGFPPKESENGLSLQARLGELDDITKGLSHEDATFLSDLEEMREAADTIGVGPHLNFRSPKSVNEAVMRYSNSKAEGMVRIRYKTSELADRRQKEGVSFKETVGLAAATLAFALISGVLWRDRFVERSTALDQLSTSAAQLRQLNLALQSAPTVMKQEVVATAEPFARAYAQADYILYDMDEWDSPLGIAKGFASLIFPGGAFVSGLATVDSFKEKLRTRKIEV